MKDKLFVVALVLCITITILLIINNVIKIKDYSNKDFKVSYDTTWKIESKKDGLELVHKKTKAKLNIKSKLLDEDNIDTELGEIINNITYSIESQNEDYNLISNERLDKYSGYSYLYENEDSNVLVNIYKLDRKLVIIYYEALFEDYDIVLDSVDNIIDSLEILKGE